MEIGVFFSGRGHSGVALPDCCVPGLGLGESGVSLEPMTIPVKGLYLPVPSYGASSPALREGSMGTSVNYGGEVSTDGCH